MPFTGQESPANISLSFLLAQLKNLKLRLDIILDFEKMNNDNKKFGEVKKEWILNLANAPKEKQELILQRFRYVLHRQKARILSEAIQKGLFTLEEYEKDYKDQYYDEFGFDGFLQYIDGVMNADADYFVTENKNLIKRREDIESKFKLKIITVSELESIKT